MPHGMGSCSRRRWGDVIVVGHLDSNQLSGSIPVELGNLTSLTYLVLSSNQLSGSIPAGVFGAFSQIRSLRLYKNAFDQAAVDAVLAQVFAARAGYTYATPELKIETNERPSGTLTEPSIIPGIGNSNGDWTWNGSCHTPQSGQARVHALKNLICGETYKTWTVTHDP